MQSIKVKKTTFYQKTSPAEITICSEISKMESRQIGVKSCSVMNLGLNASQATEIENSTVGVVKNEPVSTLTSKATVQGGGGGFMVWSCIGAKGVGWGCKVE